jgi:excisionase family DNA binding protein
MTEKTVMSIDEVSVFLGVSRPTVYNLINKQKLPFVRLGGKDGKGGRLLITLNALLKWLDDNSSTNGELVEVAEE